jgi:3-deoxy-D-manno-octulosonate 8-phosphate phosphatase KdsC-like HAD superfamily phosphatase
MFQKLRTDLVKKLAGIKLVLVNADGFISDDMPAEAAHGHNGFHIRTLRNNDVDFVAFSKSEDELISSSAERLGITLHQGVSETSRFYSGIKKEYAVSDGEVAFICRDHTDIPLMKRVVFTAVTPDAPLRVKAESYFAAYTAGSGVVGEVAALILVAKKYPGGWSD